MFDQSERLKKLDNMGDVLKQLNEMVNWNAFRSILDEAIPRIKSSKGGRPAYDNLLMFKVLVIKRLFNLSADETEFQINDRISFMRFLGLGLEDKVPDAKTIWLYEDMLSQKGAGEVLFKAFNEQIAAKGYITKAGSIVDASFIEAPKRKNTKEQREKLKKGEIPQEWADKEHPQKLRQRDTDATWTIKGKETHFGYKDTVKVDLDSKLIDAYKVSTDSVNDLTAAKGIFDETDRVAYGDAAYPSLEVPENVEKQFCESPTKNHPLSEEQKERNHQKAKLRCRVEHVFAGMVQMIGGTTLRCKSMTRAVFNISMLNLLYNMRRTLSLSRISRANCAV